MLPTLLPGSRKRRGLETVAVVLLLLPILLASVQGQAPPSLCSGEDALGYGCEQWTHVDEAARPIVRTGDGVIVVGLSDDGSRTVRGLASDDGSERWTRTFAAPTRYGYDVAVTDDGSRVHVVHPTDGDPDLRGGHAIRQVALDPATGETVWSETFDLGDRWLDSKDPIHIDTTDDRTVVAAYAESLTVEPGVWLWKWGEGAELPDAHVLDVYTLSGDDYFGSVEDVALAEDGSSVYVTGWTQRGFDAYVLAVDGTSGAERWTYEDPTMEIGEFVSSGPANRDAVLGATHHDDGVVVTHIDARGNADARKRVASDIDDSRLFTTGPDRRRVYAAARAATGAASELAPEGDTRVIAVDALDGAVAWDRRIRADLPSPDLAERDPNDARIDPVAVVVDDAGRRVHVAATSDDRPSAGRHQTVTFGLDARTGDVERERRYLPSAGSTRAFPTSVAAGDQLVVAGIEKQDRPFVVPDGPDRTFVAAYAI